MTDESHVKVQVNNHLTLDGKALDRALRRSERRVAAALAAMLDAATATWAELLGITALNLETRIVSKLSDKLDSIEKSMDAALGRVQDDVTRLNDKVAELQALVDSGSATPEDIARLDALQSKLDALDPTVDVVLPPTPEPTTPPDVTPTPPDVIPPAPDVPPTPEPTPDVPPAPVDSNSPDGTP